MRRYPIWYPPFDDAVTTLVTTECNHATWFPTIKVTPSETVQRRLTLTIVNSSTGEANGSNQPIGELDMAKFDEPFHANLDTQKVMIESPRVL